jgi:2-methylcitrate dehydratase PrpD
MTSQTLAIAQYAASTRPQHLPEQVKERARQVILDEMACAVFGRRSIAGELAARYAMQFGGTGEAHILGTRTRAPTPYAALANGAAGHGEEVDGTHVVGGHPGASIVHGALAMAERQRATGADLLNAVVLGYDVGTRVVDACGAQFSIRNRFKLHSDFLFALGVAAASSRLLGLDADRHCHALALATFQSNSLWVLFSEQRHVSKSLCNGQFAFGGISAALMAACGLEGHMDALGGPLGVLEAWGDPDSRPKLTRGLGEEFAILSANVKFINAGYPIHSPVEATMGLVRQHALRLDAIASVHVGLATNTMRVVDNRAMHNICLQDVLSACLVRGGLHLRESPFPEVLSDPDFLHLRPRVVLAPAPELDRELPEGRGAIVRITMADGSVHTRRIDWPRGHSRAGEVSWDDLAAKWREGLPECDIDRLIGLARRLDELEDVRELAAAFAVGE